MLGAKEAGRKPSERARLGYLRAPKRVFPKKRPE